jgi:hypothetical protein
MTRQNKREWRKLRPHLAGASDFRQLLDTLLALDRTVVELSMRAYKLPRQHRLAMREQNRRLHNAVRERLPRLLSKYPLISKTPGLPR